MRDLSRESQLTGASDEEVKAGLSFATRRLGHIKWKKRRLADSVNLNAIVARYLRMSPAEQEKWTREGLQALQEILSGNPFTRPELASALRYAEPHPINDDDENEDDPAPSMKPVEPLKPMKLARLAILEGGHHPKRKDPPVPQKGGPPGGQ